ncbi:MAG: hypothetical protein HFG80_08435 [Eubacterium sp.]|nr:hypothetical protein [Eubacterium sp.]
MNKKRILSAIVAFALTAALLPVHTFAAVITPDETEALSNTGQGADASGTLDNGMSERPTGRMPVKSIYLGEVDPDALDAVGSYEYTPYSVVSDWDDYASNYYYNRMDEWQRKVYDRMDEAAKYYLNMNANAPSVRGQYCIPVDLYDLQIYDDELTDIYFLFIHSNPQYFFLSNGLMWNGYSAGFNRTVVGNVYMFVYDGMANGSARRAAVNEVNGQVDVALAAARKASSSQLGQEKAVHDWICARVAYDFEFIEITDASQVDSYEETHCTQSAYSVLRKSPPSDKTQLETVCAGYAQAYSLLCNALDIDTITVTSETHQWNQTRLNGNWYIVDCTWDDIDASREEELYNYYNGYYYAFFNRSSAFVSANDPGGNHALERYQTRYLPSDMCSVDKVRENGDTNGLRCGNVKAAAGTRKTPGYKNRLRNNKIQVTLSTSDGSEIYYTVNGGQPSVNDTKSYLYKEAFEVKPGTKIRAIAYKNGYQDSKVLDMKASVSLKVTYNVNGGSKLSSKQKTKQVTYGSKYGTLAMPKRKGYTFSGWYTKKSGGSKITKNSTVKITKATTLYAHWKKVTVGKAKKPTLRSTKKRQLKISLRKVSGAKGYQIRYSTSEKFTKKTTKYVYVTQKNPTKTVKKLKSGKKYYVQVKAYKLDSANKKVYGKWSEKAVKAVK